MLEDSTPVIVGAGQFMERNLPPRQAQPPMGITANAAAAAIHDTRCESRIASMIDTVAIVRIIQDSRNRPRDDATFGRAENPPRAVARRIGANPAHAIYGCIGGDSPQTLVSEIAQAIADGDIGMALLAGGEAIHTARAAMRTGIDLNWQEEDTGSLEDRGMGALLASRHEMAHGIGIPVQTYPLFENAIRAQLGNSIDEHLRYMADLMAPFTGIANENPYAFYGERREAEELAAVDEENRFICLPYPKLMNARDSVNLGAALLMTSVGKARELGIDPGNWVYLHGCAEAQEKLVSERANYHSSPAIRANVATAFGMAGKSVVEMDFFDLYSCFPSAVELACAELELATDDSRGLTVTGGLPFFGGPGNNYSMHAIATMVFLLRARTGSYGLVTANGGLLSKHATGIYSTTPYSGKWVKPNPDADQAKVDSLAEPEFTERPEGRATVETYTVCYRRGVPERGIVIGRLCTDGRRFVANTPADETSLTCFSAEEQMGRAGTVNTTPQGNVFMPG